MELELYVELNLELELKLELDMCLELKLATVLAARILFGVGLDIAAEVETAGMSTELSAVRLRTKAEAVGIG